MNSFPKLAIIYLSYHSEEFLPEVISALKKSSYPKDKCVFIVVDNPHPEFGSSAKKIEEMLGPLSQIELPEVVVLPQSENLGYCGGNNVGINWAIKNGYDYVFLHNQDGYVSESCFEEMVEQMEKDKSIGCAQSLVVLAGTEELNTAGNVFNYLGFGYINNFGFPLKDLHLSEVQQVGYASGAALMLKADLIKSLGALDSDMFMYHEDVEYSLRLKFAGYKVVCITKALFYHQYEFSRSTAKFYYMERNRYALLMLYYRWPTLILLLPMVIIMEIGLTTLFVLKGWGKEKLKFYRYWLRFLNWKIWLKKRAKIQLLRKISDREIIKNAAGAVSFGEKQGMNNPLLKYVANPLMIVYKAIVGNIIFW